MPKITVTTTITTVFDVPEGVGIQRARDLCMPELADNEEQVNEVVAQQDRAVNQCYLGAAKQEALQISHSIVEGSNL